MTQKLEQGARNRFVLLVLDLLFASARVTLFPSREIAARRLGEISKKLLFDFTDQANTLQSVIFDESVQEVDTLRDGNKTWEGLIESFQAAILRLWTTEVVRLHQLSTTHTPTSLISMIPPPPGFPIDGEDAHAKMQSYALYPPSVNPDIRLEDQPFDEWTVSEVVRGDVNQLMRRPTKRGHEVLLAVDGPQPSVFDVRTTIAKDGMNRGMPWATLPGPDHGVTELKLAISLHGELHQRILDDQWMEEGRENGKRNDHARMFNKWIVAFQTDAEAKRFVRAWHKMPLPTWWHGTQYEEIPSIVHAELLWGNI
ncbi:MAG: hypothetical protein Q9165_000519 [Trypethelium subeluteriae]